MKDTELIVEQPKSNELAALASLPPEMMLLKMENENIMSVARVHPREPAKIVKQLAELIEAWPAAAAEAIYRKPVGSVYQVRCRNARCGVMYEVAKLDNNARCTACDTEGYLDDPQPRYVKKFAEGLSIRAAEAIRSIYGYTRLSTTTEILPDDSVRITGILVDYAAGNTTSDERIVSPWYKARGGQMVKTPMDRFLSVTVKSEKSKLRRDVILDNTPGIIKAMYRDICEQKMVALVAPEVIEQKILPFLATQGITREIAEKLVGRTIAAGWSESERLQIRKISQGLKDGETTLAELLSALEPESDAAAATPPPAAKGAVSAADLTSGKKTKKKAAAPQGELLPDAGAPEPAAPIVPEAVQPAANPLTPAQILKQFTDTIATMKSTDEVRDHLKGILQAVDANRTITDEQRAELSAQIVDATDALLAERG